MLDPDYVYENWEVVQRGADLKRMRINMPTFLYNFGFWKTMLQASEEAAHQQRLISEQIEALALAKKHSEIKPLSEKSKALKALRVAYAKDADEAKQIWEAVLMTIPMPPDDDVPIGDGPQHNVVIKTVGTETIGIFGDKRIGLVMKEYE